MQAVEAAMQKDMRKWETTRGKNIPNTERQKRSPVEDYIEAKFGSRSFRALDIVRALASPRVEDSTAAWGVNYYATVCKDNTNTGMTIL